MHRFGRIFALALLLPAVAGSAHAQSFTGIGFVSGDDESGAYAVSGDGNVVGGQTGTKPAFWTTEAGLVELSPLGPGLGGIGTGGVNGASWDGSVLVGASSTTNRLALLEPIRWQGTEPEVLATGLTLSAAGGVSGDGATVGGLGFIWTDVGGVELIDPLVALLWVSRDGSTFAGSARERAHAPPKAASWTPDGGIARLGAIPGTPEDAESRANALSADGSVIVGSAEAADGELDAFLWTAEAGMLDLDQIAGPAFRGEAWAVSDDGEIVVGEAAGVGAFVWDRLNGMQSLQTHLEVELGLDLTGWDLDAAYGISADGLTIVGEGASPASRREGWVATLPHRTGAVVAIDVQPRSPANRIPLRGRLRVGLLGSDTFDVEGVDEASLTLGPAAALPIAIRPPRDLDQDGFDDLVLVFDASDLALPLGPGEVCLAGQTGAGMPFAGCDAVEVGGKGCHHGVALAFLAPALLMRRRRSHP